MTKECLDSSKGRSRGPNQKRAWRYLRTARNQRLVTSGKTRLVFGATKEGKVRAH